MQVGLGERIRTPEDHPEAIAATPLTGHSLREEANQPTATPWLSQKFLTVNADQRPPHVRHRRFNPAQSPN